jgi:hypothetical protein
MPYRMAKNEHQVCLLRGAGDQPKFDNFGIVDLARVFLCGALVPFVRS